MDNDKNSGFDNVPAPAAEGEGSHAPRARNRTVMLTPEMTGQVRARLAQDMTPVGAQQQGLPPAQSQGSSDGFMPLSSRGRTLPDSVARPLTPLDASRATEPARSGEESPPSLLRPGVPLSGTPVFASPSSSAGTANERSQVLYTKKSKVVGFLVSYDENENGEIFELRVGRVIVTSEVSGTGNFFLVQDASVSPMHAILRVSATGEVQVLDQLSEHGTKIRRFGTSEEIELSGEKGNVEHGDVVKFGKRMFHVSMVQGLPE